MCLNLGVTILTSTIEILIVLSSQCTFGAPVWSVKDYMYLQIALALLIELYMHLIYPSVKEYDTASRICTLQKTETTRRV